MSVRKSSTRSSRPRHARRVTPLPGLRPGADLLKRIERARGERDLLAGALRHAPPLDQEAEDREISPYNSIASSEAMRRVLLKIVFRRLSGTPWVDVFRALERTDFADMLDAYRDASFMAGVEYAGRSLPDWWPEYAALGADLRGYVGVLVRSVTRKDGE